MKGRLLTLLGASALAGLLCSPTRSRAAEANFVDIPGSLQPTTDTVTGELNQSVMSVEVLLAPSNEPALHDLLANLYDSQSSSYQQWLKTGEFNDRFAPSAAQSAAVADYLRGAGLRVESTSSPFLIRATGPSSTVAAAFKTTVLTYQNRKGVSYYSNSTT
ncbi:MAG: protease pro-enzyme activation domain-containing protein, partial [Gammaproteobacteria bacterium]